jgi:hypothetical protein
MADHPLAAVRADSGQALPDHLMEIGVVPEPRQWARWEEAQALLEPARQLGGFADVLGEHELLWAVLDGDDLLAVATAALGDDHAEIRLAGGRDHRRWALPLAQAIAAMARDEGVEFLCLSGRMGWLRSLRPMGWEYRGLIEGAPVIQHRLKG